MSFRSPEHAVEPGLKELYPAEEFTLNGKEVEFHRLQHHIDVFNNNREYFERAIQRASVVVLEQAPTAEGLFTESVQKRLCEQLNKWGARITIEEFRGQIKENKFVLFFKALEDLAAARGKPLMTVDPVFREDGKWLIEIENATGAAKYGAIGVAALSVLTKIAEAKGIKLPFMKKKDPDKVPKPSRRSFLKTSAAVGFGMLAGASLSTRHGVGKDMDHQGRTTQGVGVMTFDMHDYRDTIIAEGLNQISSTIHTTGPIEAFYGASHGSPVKYYAHNEVERLSRMRMYADTIATGIHPKLRVYYYGNGGWKKEREQEIDAV